MNSKIILILLASFGVIAVFAIMLALVTKPDRNETITIVTSQPSPANTASEIPDDWEKFESDRLGVTLYYPPKMEVATNEDGTARFLLLGPSQAIGTEVYDGILLTISKGTYEEPSLKEYVGNVINQKKSDEIYIEVGDLEEIKMNDISTYMFTESSLGEFTNIYMPVEENSYLLFSYLLEDPENQDFDEILDTMLNSVDVN